MKVPKVITNENNKKLVVVEKDHKFSLVKHQQVFQTIHRIHYQYSGCFTVVSDFSGVELSDLKETVLERVERHVEDCLLRE